MVFRSNEEKQRFEDYAHIIGIPIEKWWENTWVQALMYLDGLSVEEAHQEWISRKYYHPVCRCCSTR